MCGLRTCFLCLVVAFCLLFGVSHSTNESVCVLSDAPQQCGAFCLGAVHPLCDQYAKSKQEEAIVKIIADSRAEQKELVVKLIADSRTEQMELVNRSQEEMVKMIAEFRAEQKELLNVLAANLTASRLESTLQSRPVTVPPGFQKIGSRYFFIEEKGKSWTDAEETCLKKGGTLAALGNEDDFEAVTRIVEKDTIFWLGYHRNSKDEFVTATGNKGSFMKWDSGEPDNKGGKQNCVALFNSLMYDGECKNAYGFICQLDTV
ncbi:C-type lectin domain family 4 member G-like [Drosophila teissieri]|uniref:C-type lectin domain family 4 member G-like n=1 Tax=Drosophila teissieri TaxID=7243 RepID=UPI001CBA1023|nr:C-type lectin domain family 4 member G-like [Drosophila teissieri]